MKTMKMLVALALACALAPAAPAFAQQAGSAAQPAAEQAWKYQVKQLTRADVDALLARPESVLVLDVRRPDELTAKGGFPVYLNIQAKEVEKYLAYIPKDRTIVTVSNHAHRAGAVGDLLASKGYKVAGATGSEDYEAQGGTVARWAPPAPKAPAKP